MLTITKPPFQPQTPKPQLKPPIPERRAEEGSGQEGSGQEDQIRPLAYLKWQEAGCPIGDGVEFWLAAETEILRRKKPR